MTTLYQVAVKQGDMIIHTDTVHADTPNEAAEKARKYSQAPYNFVEVYDAHDEAHDAKPIFSKVAVG
jgi:lipopolysaccharide export system protein LptA